MEQELDIKRRSQSAETVDFDYAFAGHQPAASNQNKLNRIEYTRILLKLSDTRMSEFWTAAHPHSNEVLARIGADVKDSQGSIGFLEANPTKPGRYAASVLINAALDWLKSKGVATVYGPMDFNSWFNYRFKVQSDSTEATANHPWEPASSNFCESLFRSNGFSDAILYSSHFFELSDASHWQQHINHLEADYDRVLDAGFKIRKIANNNRSEQDIRAIFDISNVAFANHPMFESVPFSLFSAITLPALTHFDSTPSRICFDKNNNPVGFMFAFLIDDLIVFKSIAILPEFQAMGIGNAMTLELCQFGFENRVTRCVGALIRRGNKSEMFGKSFNNVANFSGRNDYVLLSRSFK